MIAHVLVEQVLTLEPDREGRNGRAAPAGLGRVAQVRIEKCVTLCGRFVLADLRLVEGMQEAGARGPVGIPVIEPKAGAVRRNSGHVTALRIRELGVHEIVLPVDAPGAAPDLADILLRGQLQPVELSVALLENHLIEVAARPAVGRAGRQRRVAGLARALPVDEAVESRVVERAVEAEVALGPPQAHLNAARDFLVEVRIADLERRRRVVPALREQFRRIRRPLHVLCREARDHVGRQLVEHAETGTHRREAALRRDLRRLAQIADVEPGP